MQEITFFDDPTNPSLLYPLTYTRPAAKLLIGIDPIENKWLKRLDLQADCSYLSADYLHIKFLRPKYSRLYINGCLLPYDNHLLKKIIVLADNQSLYNGTTCLAYRSPHVLNNLRELEQALSNSQKQIYTGSPRLIQSLLDLFKYNQEAIVEDFNFLKQQGRSNTLHDQYTVCYGKDHIFVEQGAQVYNSTLIADSNNPIYIGKNAVIEAGCLIKGAFALDQHAQLSLGTKIKGNTSIGQHCKVGGEISNSIVHAYSNKGHDGFLGHSILGSWCNLGAATNTSNLKNNYGLVKVWNFDKLCFQCTNEQFCGLLMGDHSKSSIGTTFNTGTTVGIGCNIFGSGFPPKYIPNFSWGGFDNQTFNFAKFEVMAARMMQRRNLNFEESDYKLMQYLYQNY